MKAAEVLQAGDPILIRWKTSRFTRLYKTTVVDVEGNIVALEAIYDKKGLIPFDRGITELIPVGHENIYQNLRVIHSHVRDKEVYLVSGNAEGSIYTEHRKFVRFSVNLKCSIGDYSAILADVSSGGFRVLVANNYPVGTWLKINEYFDVRGIVVRKDRSSVGMYSYGCQVLDPTKSFLNFISEQEANGAPILNYNGPEADNSEYDDEEEDDDEYE